MHTTIQKSLLHGGNPPAASMAPQSANGSAKIECSHLIISRVVRDAPQQSHASSVIGDLAKKPGPRASAWATLTMRETSFSFEALATCRLFVTLKTPGTPLARMPAVSLSAWLHTTPFKVTLPFTTVMRIGCAGSMAYLFRLGKPYIARYTCQTRAIIHGRQRIDLDVIDHILHAREMAGERNCGIGRDRSKGIAGQRHHTILHIYADGIERVAVTHAIVLQLLARSPVAAERPTFPCALNLQFITHGDHVLHAMRLLVDFFLGGEILDRSFEVDDAILHR